MANTLRQLAVDLRDFAESLPAQTNQIAKDAATAVATDLIQVTPVDTGKAMSNWIPSLDAPSDATIDAFVPSPRGYMEDNRRWTHTVDPSITFAANVGPALDAAKLIIEQKQPGQPLFIANNLPYIQPLDEGHSLQTPAGFVDRALLLAESVISASRIS